MQFGNSPLDEARKSRNHVVVSLLKADPRVAAARAARASARAAADAAAVGGAGGGSVLAAGAAGR